VRWETTQRLLDTVPAHRAIAEAADRGRLAEQVAIRRAELAALEDVLDGQLDQLDQVVRAAGRVDDLLDDLRLAERLVSLDPLAIEAQMRRNLPSVSHSGVAELAAGTGAVEELLRDQVNSLCGGAPEAGAGPAPAPPDDAGPADAGADKAASAAPINAAPTNLAPTNAAKAAPTNAVTAASADAAGAEPA
jgi:hypothetical protein